MIEYQFDGLTGPSHNYAGLAYGNKASQAHKYTISHPKKAALEGIQKMRLLLSWGIPQGFIPPHERPLISHLRKMGYCGADEDIFTQAADADPETIALISSASSMWVANAATITPSADSKDKKAHITPANLIAEKHRVIETEFTEKILKIIFPPGENIMHHATIEKNKDYGDEGAANHMRFGPHLGKEGINVFVYGKSKSGDEICPIRYPARQSLEASQMIASLHGLYDEHVIFVKQNPAAIDAGVFHNDVIAISNENHLILHEEAFSNQEVFVKNLTSNYRKIFGKDMILVTVSQKDLSIKEAVMTYFFNSQLVSTSKGMKLIAPHECAKNKRVQRVIDHILSTSNEIQDVHFVELTESMKNGGGPACLRLRVLLSQDEASEINQAFILDHKKLDLIEKWVCENYRDEFSQNDLEQFHFVEESRETLDKLTKIIGCGPIYSFQSTP